MARKLPSNLALRLPAYHTVIFDGAPMYRAQAWAILDYRLHGGHGSVNSAIRRDSVVRRWRGHGLRPGYSSQKELYDGYQRGLPGYFPANPPGYSTHEGYADGVAVFHRKDGRVAHRGEPIVEFEWGIDYTNAPGGSAEAIVSWLNRHSYKAVRPYNTNSERHHLCFRKSPATNARLRLAKWLLTGR